MPKKILLVENEEIIYSLLQKKLSNKGYEVFIARDGDEALKIMKEQKPDLVLLDIMFPVKGGFEVMEEMEDDDNLKNIPVIIISNSGQPIELDKAKDLGAKDWLIKTEFDPEDAVEKVKKQIG